MQLLSFPVFLDPCFPLIIILFLSSNCQITLTHPFSLHSHTFFFFFNQLFSGRNQQIKLKSLKTCRERACRENATCSRQVTTYIQTHQRYSPLEIHWFSADTGCIRHTVSAIRRICAHSFCAGNRDRIVSKTAGLLLT